MIGCKTLCNFSKTPQNPPHRNQPDSGDGVDEANRAVRVLYRDPRVARPVLLAAHAHVRVETEGQQQAAQQVAVVLVVALRTSLK